MAISCQLLLQQLHRFCPPRLALEKDPTGLQVGTANKTVSRVLCTLDLTLAVAEEARDKRVDLIISHHAVIFRPLRDLRTDHSRGRILELLLKHDIAVYVPHTALDVTAGGSNDDLARRLGLESLKVLKATSSTSSALLQLDGSFDRQAANQLLRRGNAQILNRSDGSLQARVPAGEAASLAKKLERGLACSASIIPLSSPLTTEGIGRIGRLSEAESLRSLALRVKRDLDAPAVRVTAPDLERNVDRVAVLCGDGRSFIDAASFAGAQAMVTGDVDHHTALEALARDLALIDVGHWASERHVAGLLQGALSERLADEDVDILASTTCTQPFNYLT